MAAPRPRTLSVSANLALSVEKMHLNSVKNAAPGETQEPRGASNPQETRVSLYPFLFPASVKPLPPPRAPLCLWGLLSLQQCSLPPLFVLHGFPSGPFPRLLGRGLERPKC